MDGLDDFEYDVYQKWKKKQLEAKAIAEEWRLQENRAKAIAYEETIKKNWETVQQQLKGAPDSIIRQALLKDVEWSKKMLQYVIDKNLPPPWYAVTLLKMISE